MSIVARHRPASAVAAALVAVIVLVGCTGQRDPDEWSDSVKKDFIAACVGEGLAHETVDGYQAVLDANAQSQEDCECVAEGLEEDIEFSDLKDFTSRNRDLPPGETEAFDDEAIPGLGAVYEKCGIGTADSTDTTTATTTDGEAQAEGEG